VERLFIGPFWGEGSGWKKRDPWSYLGLPGSLPYNPLLSVLRMSHPAYIA